MKTIEVRLTRRAIIPDLDQEARTMSDAQIKVVQSAIARHIERELERVFGLKLFTLPVIKEVPQAERLPFKRGKFPLFDAQVT